jgi:hypothetical protein
MLTQCKSVVALGIVSPNSAPTVVTYHRVDLITSFTHDLSVEGHLVVIVQKSSAHGAYSSFSHLFFSFKFKIDQADLVYFGLISKEKIYKQKNKDYVMIQTEMV